MLFANLLSNLVYIHKQLCRKSQVLWEVVYFVLPYQLGPQVEKIRIELRSEHSARSNKRSNTDGTKFGKSVKTLIYCIAHYNRNTHVLDTSNNNYQYQL